MSDIIQYSNVLHMGAIVHLSCFKDHTNFYVYSNGISFKTLMSMSAEDGPLDMNKCLFKIVPAMKYQQEEMMAQILKNRYKNDEVDNIIDDKKAKSFIDQFDFELTQNNEMVEQLMRFPIHYNENFMLQHRYSSKYLAYVKDIQSNQYVLQLSDIPTSNCFFSLKPSFNYQQEINANIPFNSAAFLTVKIHEGLHIKEFYLNFNINSVFDSWYLSEEEKQIVKVGLFQTAEDVDYKNICFGDAIWLFHLQSGSFLKVKEEEGIIIQNYTLNRIKFLLGFLNENKQNQMDDGDQRPKSKIELQKSESQLSAEKFGLWKIFNAQSDSGKNRKDHSDHFIGGKIKYDQKIQFFNVRYGVYLSVRQFEIRGKKSHFYLATEKNSQLNTIFKIVTSSSHTYATTEDLFLIQNQLTGFYLNLAEPFKFGQVIAPLEVAEKSKKQDYFKFTKVDFLQEWQNSFILSVLPYIRQGVKNLREIRQGYTSRRSNMILSLLDVNLLEMLAFSFDLTEGFEASQNKLGKMTYNHYLVQKILRDQGIINALVELLQTVNVELLEEYMNQQLRQESSFKIVSVFQAIKKFTPDLDGGNRKDIPVDLKLLTRIVNTSLKILRNCCKFNTENSLYLFKKKIDVFIRYLSIETEGEHFFMDSFHNREVLQKISKKQIARIIQQYIKIHLKYKRYLPQIFTLLTKLFKNDEETVSKNQLEIFELFFYENNPLALPIKTYGQNFYVNFNRQNRQLNQLCSQNEEIAIYLAKQIQFYANLTYDRNYVCSKTIKKIFPIDFVIDYMTKRKETQQIMQQSFLCIFNHCYLNERPRFKENNPLIFSVNQRVDEPMRRRRTMSEQIPQFEVEMQMMKHQGISQENIEDILSCIHQKDHLNSQILERVKQWVKEWVAGSVRAMIEKNESSYFYSSKMRICLECLKLLMELSMLGLRDESRQFHSLIDDVIEQMGKSFIEVNEVIDVGGDFRTLLKEMLHKNIIQKFQNSLVKYDGLQDEINPQNICSIFVHYSFYQNILLEDRGMDRRREKNSVIKVILDLIKIKSTIILQEKINKTVNGIIERQQQYSRNGSKETLIQEIIINQALEYEFGQRQKLYTLLVLLFYNWNSYEINYNTLNLMLTENISDYIFIDSFRSMIFMVDRLDHEQFQSVHKNFKSIRLLIETSQIWLNNNAAESREQQYDSIILLFVNQIKSILKIVVPGLNEDKPDILSWVSGIMQNIVVQKQIMLSNLNLEQEIISFVKCYSPLIKQIKKNKNFNSNHIFVSLFKICFLFLYVFIYNNAENKKKIRGKVINGNMSEYWGETGVQLGETMLCIEYLKDNYEECIQFYAKNHELMEKHPQYTKIHSKLLATLFSFHGEPVLANLKKFFIYVFDFIGFKNFLFLNHNSKFDLSLNYFLNSSKQPIFYHINALTCVLLLTDHLTESRNPIRNHIRKSLTQQYLYQILFQDDYYSKQNSNKAILKVMIELKLKVVKIIKFAYLSDDVRKNEFVLRQLERQSQTLDRFMREIKARQETKDFRKVIPLRQLRKEESTKVDQKIQQIYEVMNEYEENLLSNYLQIISSFSSSFLSHTEHLKNPDIYSLRSYAQNIIRSANQIHQIRYGRILWKDSDSERLGGDDDPKEYPIPQEWLFMIPAANRDEISYRRRTYYNSVLIETIFSKQVYQKIQENEQKKVTGFIDILQKIHLKQFFFLRKISEFIEDAFEKLENDESIEVYQCLKRLLLMLTQAIKYSESEKVNELRGFIGKSQLIFPILNYFQICHFNQSNRQLFLYCLEFYNQLLGEEGNRMIQSIFHQYFVNKNDSHEFFMKIKQIFDEIHLEDKAFYKCNKIQDGIEVFSQDVKLEKKPEFILLNFLIRLCKGNFRENQIFLSSLRHFSNFNIMNGIWRILIYNSHKYKQRVINVENYTLITQCFSTIRELVQGPCTENQNQFLKKDFLKTILDFFKYEENSHKVILSQSLSTKLQKMKEVSQNFTNKLSVYLNRDKLTEQWMPSQVKYQCISLICSLFAENVNQNSQSQLSGIPINDLVAQIDRVYDRFTEMELEYDYQCLKIKQNEEIILPLGFKLYQVLQQFPKEKIPTNSRGITFFTENSRTVEVIHNQNLCFVTFPKPPNPISEAFKANFLEDVDRTSINSKLKGLQDSEIQNKQSDNPYGYLMFLLVLGLCICDLLLMSTGALPFVRDFNFFTILRLYGVTSGEEIASAIILSLILFFSLIFSILQIRGAVYYRERVNKILFSEELSFGHKLIQYFKFIFAPRNYQYYHYLLIFVLALLSSFAPFFDGPLLAMELYRRSETFSAIMNAIISSLAQLGVVLIFTLICCFVLTTSIYYYRALESFPNQCSTLYYCFVFSLDNSFRADAGIVGYNDDQDTILSDFLNVNFGDVLMNFVYLFIIKVIIDQIIGAIMVDKFAEIREEKQKLKEDENSYCFICGLGRNLLDREEDGFEKHKQEYHNLWNYFQFLSHIRRSQKSNFSGIEWYVFREQDNGRLNWFPINRSLHLEMRKTRMEEEEHDKQDQIEKNCRLIDQQMIELKKNIEDIQDLVNIKFTREKIKH